MAEQNPDWSVLHVRVPTAHKERMHRVITHRGDDYGAYAAFIRRAMETQLCIEEHINGITGEPPLPRALLTMRAALDSGFNPRYEPSERDSQDSNAESSEKAKNIGS